VRDGCPGDWVQKENFRPRRCTTFMRVDLDFRKHFVEGCETLGLFLEEPPKPVLKHGVRGCIWRATIRASCDAVPFDRLSNVPIQQRIASQSTCRGARAPQKARPAVSSVSVISSASSWRRRAMVFRPVRVVTKARAAALSLCPSGRERARGLPIRTQRSGGRVHGRWAAAVWHG
jgi:hypothetical protein